MSSTVLHGGATYLQGRAVLIEAPTSCLMTRDDHLWGEPGKVTGGYVGVVRRYDRRIQASRLSELLIGSGVSGYQNTNLTVLSIGTNNMLRKLDIRNCPNLRQAVDISGCENMEEVYAQALPSPPWYCRQLVSCPSCISRLPSRA